MDHRGRVVHRTTATPLTRSGATARRAGVMWDARAPPRDCIHDARRGFDDDQRWHDGRMPQTWHDLRQRPAAFVVAEVNGAAGGRTMEPENWWADLDNALL